MKEKTAGGSANSSPAVKTERHGMTTLLRHRTKHKRGGRTSEDLRLLRLLHIRRHRLEGERLHVWDRAISLEIDLLVALEEAVLTGWGKRLGMQ